MEQRQNRVDSRARERAAARDRRKAARLPLVVDVGLKESRYCIQRSSLVDISASGCRLHTGFPLKTGSSTTLLVPGFEPFFAEVIWSCDGDAGLRFNRSLHPSVVAHILTKSTPVQSLTLSILRSYLGKPVPEEKP